MKIILIILSIITTFLAPIQGLLILMILFIFSDTAFGIYASLRLKEAFKSHKLFNVVVKSFFYLFTIILCFFVDKYIFEDSLFQIKFLFAKTITAFWIYIEVKSLDETSIKLGNKSLWVLLKEFFGKVKDFKKDISTILDEERNEK